MRIKGGIGVGRIDILYIGQQCMGVCVHRPAWYRGVARPCFGERLDVPREALFLPDKTNGFGPPTRLGLHRLATVAGFGGAFVRCFGRTCSCLRIAEGDADKEGMRWCIRCLLVYPRGRASGFGGILCSDMRDNDMGCAGNELPPLKVRLHRLRPWRWVFNAEYSLFSGAATLCVACACLYCLAIAALWLALDFP